ncbi:DUF4783 domain-containing protein [Prolixibacter sp. NT017]|nr:DUF4783 domain-containing protein [Prolixibacter sp. NT017]
MTVSVTKYSDMKKKAGKILIALFLFILPATALYAQMPDQIIIGLSSGNAKKLAAYFNDNVELVILNRENVCSQAQAEQILKDFFAKNKPNQFRVIHQGGKEDARYAIGSLETDKETFRVYFLLKNKDNKPLIHQLRIEKE